MTVLHCTESRNANCTCTNELNRRSLGDVTELDAHSDYRP